MDFNYKILIKISSLILAVTGISMIPSIICAAYYGETACLKAFAFFFVLFTAAGFLIYKAVPARYSHISARDGFLIVAACWIVSCLFGAFPYMFSGEGFTFAQSVFESTAGFTTTGATSVDGFLGPKSLILFKAVAHWLGGMGILILAVSILPAMGIGGQNIAKAETPAPKVDKLSNRISDSARILYIMYFTLSFMEFILLIFNRKVTVFDALVNTLSTISTSGIITHETGLAFYESFYVEIVITVFTIFASINFNLYYFLLNRRIKEFFGNTELRAFLGIVAIVTVIITVNLWINGIYDGIFSSLRYAFIQVVSFISTSGFTFTNFMSWPVLSKLLLFMLMFIGGCAASTGGGIKVIRVVVMMKLIFRGFKRRIHPRSVVAVKIGGKAVSGPMVSQISTFILVYLLVYIVSCVILSLNNLDFETTLTTAAGIMSNSGIGMGMFGTAGNLSMFNSGSQLFMSLLMLIGRLELFTLLFLFVPSFWNPTRQKN